MHEMGIAGAVLEAVRKECVRYPGAVPCKVGLRVGELAAVDQEALRFCFEALTKETELEPLQLEVEFCPRRHRCRACGAEFTVKEYEFTCPACAARESDCIGGDELELAYLEVEEHEPSAAGR